MTKVRILSDRVTFGQRGQVVEVPDGVAVGPLVAAGHAELVKTRTTAKKATKKRTAKKRSAD